MARFNHDLLRPLRLDLGMSQDEAACALRIDVRTYRRYESGAVNERGRFEVEMALRCHLLAAQVGRKANGTTDADRATDAGLLLARTHGFKRFTVLFEALPSTA